ncbi:hypothetical protein RclHR1_04330008 [Rhizophagus clarus]|uniref:Uncharacterized protein n=1 Tax=Rhizophagus clarus TaxID=94130 RepID=A0A2Z6RXY0_9GLOM|nr:hypothetical protein RclHR1_04330008 [Rhizophagus clarus]
MPSKLELWPLANRIWKIIDWKGQGQKNGTNLMIFSGIVLALEGDLVSGSNVGVNKWVLGSILVMKKWILALW